MVRDPPAWCTQAPRTFINDKSTFLRVPILLHIPGILRCWAPFFVSFFSGDLLGRRCPFLLPFPGQVLLGSMLIIEHCFHKIYFSLAKGVMVGRDPYEPFIQPPFNTLMVRGWYKVVLMEPWASQQHMIGHLRVDHMKSGQGYYWPHS